MENAVALALVLILVGVVLLVAELFVPSFGVLTALGVAAIVVGLALTFLYGDSTTALLTMLAVFLLVPVLMIGAFQVWQRSPLSRKLIKSGPDDDATMANMPVNVELEQLRGRYGKTVSSLRPSGVVDFDGRRIDVLSEGMLVEPDTWVRCIEVKAGRVIVRPVERPPNLADLENAKFT